MIKHFILIAWRNIKRKKSLSLIQILCLSTGLAAFILVTRYVQYEKDWDKFNENYDRIYRAQSYRFDDRMSDVNQVPVPLSEYLKENIPEVENAITLREIWGEYLSSSPELIFKEMDGYLSPSDVFTMFSFKLIRGNKKDVLDQSNSVVLNQTLAEKYFPGQDPMGKILLDEQKREWIVTGIMKDIPEQSEIRASYFKSNKNLLETMADNWGNSSFRSMVLLRPNVSHQLISEKISHILREHDKDSKQVLYLHPLSELHLKSGPRDDRGSVIFFFSFIGILTLLLACVSFMNLTTSFSSLRSVEIGIRKVAGSNRNFIRIQFLAEAIVISFISFAFAIVLAHLILPLFNSVVNRNIELLLLKNPPFLLFLLVTVIITGFIGGSYPALIISGFKPVSVLKGNSPFKKGKITGLKGMVYFQFILSVVLITSSLWMYKQVNFLKNKDLGFNKENLLHCKIPSLDTDVSYQFVREQILKNPGIEEMSISINSPMHSNWGTRVKFEGGPAEDHIYFRWNQACPNFINTMGMELADGRNFSDEFSADNNKCLINETAVKKLGWENPIGKWIETDERYTVVGVIKDFNRDDVHNPILPYFLLLHNRQFGENNDLNFKINPATMESSLDYINTVLTDLFPNVLFEVNGYDVGTYRMALMIWTNAKDTFAFFTVLAVIIAAMGLFGLVVFASQRKVKEIGIRKVQGAKARQILPLITKQFLILVIIANINVIPLAYWLERITPGMYKYQFKIIDLLTVLSISLVITLIASGYQSIKASRLNPVEALRYE